MNTRILVVDDERWVVQAIRSYLEDAHFDVCAAHTGREAIEQFDALCPDLVILDWMLPEMDGLNVAKAIRSRSRTPIIMLSARVEEEDRILGLESGVDDYIVKPFSARELEARVRAVLRRTSGTSSSILDVGPLRLDRDRRDVRVRGEPVELTAMEFDLLAFLMANPGRVFTRAELLEAVRGDAYGGFERSIDSHIKRLRQKVEVDARQPEWILTVFGVGYKLAKEVPR
jgi:DNA-binding response OmpR family regulator